MSVAPEAAAARPIQVERRAQTQTRAPSAHNDPSSSDLAQVQLTVSSTVERQVAADGFTNVLSMLDQADCAKFCSMFEENGVDDGANHNLPANLVSLWWCAAGVPFAYSCTADHRAPVGAG